MIPIPRPPHQDVEQRWADRYGYTACARVAGHDLTVCAASPNKGYLPAAVATLTQIYDGSAHPEARPRLVRLTNSGTQGDNQHPIGLEVPARHRCRPQPRSPPPAALGSATRDSLVCSTHAWCPGTAWRPGTTLSDLQALFGIEEFTRTPPMDSTLTALGRCRSAAELW